MNDIGHKVSHVRREVRKGQTRDHECHATGCTKQVPPAYLMCGKHWKMVPADIQRRIWQHYQAGQERGDARPTEEYFEAFHAAINAVAQGRLPL
jgi:hypothetical protein